MNGAFGGSVNVPDTHGLLGLAEGDDQIVAATIHLDHLGKDEVEELLKIIHRYDKNLELKTKADLNARLGMADVLLNAGAPKLQAPSLDVHGPKGKLNAPSIKGNLATPSVNGELPQLDLKSSTPERPDLSLGQNGKFRLPKVNMSGPDVKGANLDGTISTPNVSVSSPTISSPNVSAEVGKPGLTYKPPKFKMPNFGSHSKKTKVEGGLKTSTPEVKADLESPDFNLKVPKIDGDLKATNVEAALKGPNLKADVPDIEAPSGKRKWPKWHYTKAKTKTLGVGANIKTPEGDLSVPELKADVRTPDVNVNLPSADLSGPDFDSPNFDVNAPSGKMKLPKFKIPIGKLKGPSVDVNQDLKTPDLNLSAPKVDADIRTPNLDVDFPDANIEAPGLDIPTRDIDIEAPSGKMKWPNFKKPAFGAKIKGPNVDMDPSVSKPDLSLSAPQFKGDINAPDVHLTLPRADIETPEADLKAPKINVDASSEKYKFPTLKMRKLNLHKPKVAGPNLDADINTPKMDVSSPGVNVNMPKVEMDEPNLDVKSPKLQFSGVNLSAPGIKGDVSAPTVNADLPSSDLWTADTHLKTPNVGTPSAKVKGPHLKKTKFTLPAKAKAPKVDTSLQTPDVDVNLPTADIRGPDLDLTPDLSVSAPNMDLSLPEANIKGPDVDLKAPDGKLKTPHFKMPKLNLSGAKVKTPKVNADADLRAPTVDMRADVKGPGFNQSTPNMDLSVPRTDAYMAAPAVDLDLPNAEFGVPHANIDAKTPGLNLSSPNVDVSLPKGNFESPDVDLKVPDADIDGPSGKLKRPHFKMPKLNFSGTKKDPKIDAKADADISFPRIDGKMNAPDIDLNLPKAELSTPDVNIKAPKAEMNVPDVDVKAPEIEDFNFKKPKPIKVKTPDIDSNSPDLSLSAPTVEAEPLNGKFNLPTADLKSPEVDVKPPAVDVDAPKGKFTFPALKMSRYSGPKVKSSDVDVFADIDGPNLSMSAPRVETANMDVRLPAVDAGSPDISADALKTKFKWPFSKSNYGAKGTSEDCIDALELDVEESDANVTLPKNIPMFKTHRLPSHSIDGMLMQMTGTADLNSDPIEPPSERLLPLTKMVLKTSPASPANRKGQTHPVDIKERLRLFTARSASEFPTPSGKETQPAAASLEVSPGFTNPDDAVNPDSEANKISLSLDNMLCLPTRSNEH